ncbi:hypothetical protein LQK80_21135 [Bacillus thuringiensis]|nr:hypothetical protein [Bacillus thuringiensis]
MENGHLAKVDLTKKIESKSKYNKKLEKYQRRLLALQQILKEEKSRLCLLWKDGMRLVKVGQLSG